MVGAAGVADKASDRTDIVATTALTL